MATIQNEFHEICGAIHLHTSFSDGGVSYDELIATARNVGLDYIVVTDHMSLKGRELGFNKFHENFLVVVGYEHNDLKNHNHYLALGIDRVFKEYSSAGQYVTAVRDAGGVGFLAHPYEKRKSIFN